MLDFFQCFTVQFCFCLLICWITVIDFLMNLAQTPPSQDKHFLTFLTECVFLKHLSGFLLFVHEHHWSMVSFPHRHFQSLIPG